MTGAEIKARRHALGWSQRVLAGRARTAQLSISRTENDRPVPPESRERIVAALLNPDKQVPLLDSDKARDQLKDPQSKALGLAKKLAQYLGEIPFDPDDPDWEPSSEPRGRSSLAGAGELHGIGKGEALL